MLSVKAQRYLGPKIQGGQIFLEYILLVLVMVTVGGIIVKGLINRDPDNQGALIKQWSRVLTLIGEDLPHR